MTWWYSRVAPLIARGVATPPTAMLEPEWVVSYPAEEPRLVVFCPTITLVDNAEPQAEAVLQFASHLERGLNGGELPPCLLLLGVHHSPEQRDTAVLRIHALEKQLEGSPVAFAAFCTTVPGKVMALNVAIDFAVSSGALGLLQLDDDIRLRRGAIERLYSVYSAAGRPLAVGAVKVGVSRRNPTSRVMRWSKHRTHTAISYPHSCCMLLDPRLLAPGIPRRYTSDDAYICFRLLRPEQANPLDLLRLVPEAQCVHFIGGPGLQAIRRVRGILLNVHVLLSDFREDVSRYYFREILFPGFWPLGSVPSIARPFSWMVQALYFSWFAAVGLELALRGACRRPLRDIGWMPVPDRELPEPKWGEVK